MKSNIHFLNIVMIAVIAIIIDYIIYITSWPYKIVASVICITILTIYIWLIKKGKIQINHNFEMLDLIFWIIIIGFAIININKPDFSYDVDNYHIYLQENIKIDKINFDFFVGNAIQGFLFPLGDRMHYLIRTFLGYRLGTILSYYAIIVIYYQTKEIFQHFFGKHKLIPICSILCYSSSILRQWIGTYYIDLFSVVFLLGVINYALKKDILKDKKNLFFVALIAGIATGIKVTNIILLIPIGIYVIIMERKNFNKKKVVEILIAVAIFFIPFTLYIIDNISQTGSPLFPYYNNIFKSEFFGDFSWKDHRFGIPSVLHALVWPIYTSSIKLGYGDDWYIADYIWAIGYVFTIITVIYCITKRKKESGIFSLGILSLGLTLIWIIALEGYMRYALIIPVMYSIVIGYVILNKTKDKEIKISSINESICIIIVALIMLIKIIPEIDQFMLANVSRMIIDNNKTIHIDGVWGVLNDDSALTELVREEGTPIYNLEMKNTNTSKVANEIYQTKIKDKDIYILTLSASSTIKKLQDRGFETEFVRKYTTEEIPYIYYGNIMLYKIRMNKVE